MREENYKYSSQKNTPIQKEKKKRAEPPRPPSRESERERKREREEGRKRKSKGRKGERETGKGPHLNRQDTTTITTWRPGKKKRITPENLSPTRKQQNRPTGQDRTDPAGGRHRTPTPEPNRTEPNPFPVSRSPTDRLTKPNLPDSTVTLPDGTGS